MPVSKPKQSAPLHLIPVSSMRGVGDKLQESLATAGIHSVQDLLFTLPRNYQDRTRITRIADAPQDTPVQIQGEIVAVSVIPTRRGQRMLKYRLADNSGEVAVTLFRFYPNQLKLIKQGNTLRLFGEIKRDLGGYQITHPEFTLVDPKRPPPLPDSLQPVYKNSDGITPKQMLSLTKQALQLLHEAELEDWVPQPGSPSLAEALQLLHRPPADVSMQQLALGTHPCQRRLAYEELLAHRIALMQRKRRLQSMPAPAIQPERDLSPQLIDNLPFKLTQAQLRCTKEITDDLRRSFPMQRLLQGDVGSGKTLVAVLSALHAIAAGYQAALMAPTEILAEQHFINISQWLEALGLKTEWLTSNVKGKARGATLQRLSTNSSPIVIGTHALLEDAVKFHQLGLVIIDEQHRFGVEQRLKLNEKTADGSAPHQLILTATPIPRTLAMTLYADLDVSKIDEMPPGRKPILTRKIPWNRRGELIERVHQNCRNQVQCYWVCALIDESEVIPAAAAEASAEELRRNMPDVRIGLVHGKLSHSARTEVMDKFRNGQLDILVATTVIEVGVDVPNASIMVIENAERFGLAQLHQLRGRVGRGSKESYCILLHGESGEDTHSHRLDAMCKTNDGFEIAEADLKLRGSGELMGTQQKGYVDLRIADYARDADLLDGVRQSANTLLNENNDCARNIVERWIGDESTRYAQV